MKILLFLILLICSISVSAQTTSDTTTTGPAQTELNNFVKGWIGTNWTGMTNTQKNNFVQEHYRLMIAAAKEIDLARVQAEAAAKQDSINQAAATAAQKQQWITFLKKKGFVCDNRVEDWILLYNHPRIFGSNYEVTAINEHQRSLSLGGLDYFLSESYRLWQDYVRNNE